jgi:hypothetical protein
VFRQAANSNIRKTRINCANFCVVTERS